VHARWILNQLVKFSRCIPGSRTWWRAPYLKDNVDTDVSGHFYSSTPSEPCFSLFGPFVGHLVVLKHLELSLANFRYSPGERPCRRHGCPDFDPPSCDGYAQGWAGVAKWGALIPILSPQAFPLRLCAVLYLYRKTLGLPELVSFISLPKKYSPLPTVLSKKEGPRVWTFTSCLLFMPITLRAEA
jgi:hypothetical protein